LQGACRSGPVCHSAWARSHAVRNAPVGSVFEPHAPYRLPGSLPTRGHRRCACRHRDKWPRLRWPARARAGTRRARPGSNAPRPVRHGRDFRVTAFMYPRWCCTPHAHATPQRLRFACKGCAPLRPSANSARDPFRIQGESRRHAQQVRQARNVLSGVAAVHRGVSVNDRSRPECHSSPPPDVSS
jgi:hypothetical protein